MHLATSEARIALLRRSAWWIFAALVAADLAAALIRPLGTLGAILWFVSYVYFIAFAAIAGRDVVADAIANREAFLIIVIAVYVAIVAGNLTNPASYSAEAGHEIDCTLRLFASAGDHGFRGTCLFGYPARQYFLPALPSLLFGRSQLSLNAGGDLYFLLGVLIFAGGAIRYQRANEVAGPIAALLLTVFLHVYYWSHFILIYEQSIFPLSFALLGGGLLLYYLSGETAALPLGGLLLLYLIESYTPSLAVYGLGLAVIGYLAVRRGVPPERAAALIGGSLIVLFLSLTCRGDLNVSSGANPTLRQDIWTGFENLVYLNHGLPVTSPVLVCPFLIAVALCLSWQFGLEGFVIGCWVVAVYLMAVVSHGYSLNSVDVRTHRAIIMFPVLITLGAVIARRFPPVQARNAVMVVALVMLATGLKFHLDYRNAQAPEPSLSFVSWVHTHVHAEGSIAHPVPMWWTPGTDQFLPAVRDVLNYFDPGFAGGVIDSSLLGSGCPAAKALTGVIVLQASEPCVGTLQHQVGAASTRFDGYFVDVSGRSLAVFERPAGSGGLATTRER